MPSSNDEVVTQEESVAKGRILPKPKRKAKKGKKAALGAFEPDADEAQDSPVEATSEPRSPFSRPIHSSASPSPTVDPDLLPTPPEAEFADWAAAAQSLDQRPGRQAEAVAEEEPEWQQEQAQAQAQAQAQDWLPPVQDLISDKTTRTHGDDRTVDYPPVVRKSLQDAASHPALTEPATLGQHPPSFRISPRPAYRQPYQSALRPTTQPMASTTSRGPRVHDAPPPHMPQSHFSRTPDHDFGLIESQQVVPGSGKYCCRFDSLENTSGPFSSSSVHNVILIGGEGSLDICRVNRKGKDTIGYVEGLRGSVIDAKVLPWTGRTVPSQQARPLVACILHGPVLDENADSDTKDASHDTVKGEGSLGKNVESTTAFQSTVEVFSPGTEQHVATLYHGPITHSKYPINHPLFSPPLPTGNLSIAAEGRYIIVTSGQSGEIYVFTLSSDGGSSSVPAFKCIGKLWTTVRTRQQPAPTAASTNVASAKITVPDQRFPIFALSKRWLAIAPPMMSSSQVSLDGTVRNQSPPGVSAYVSPAPPAADCEVDLPHNGSVLTRVTRQATQELRKGAQWVGEQGMNAFRNYWGRAQPADVAAGSQGAINPPVEDHTNDFPPTHAHAHDTEPVVVEPALVSIVDLHKLEDRFAKNPLAPIATWNLVDGCSFLSFAPTGLALLSTNKLGDVSNVWDLMQITDATTASTLTVANGGGLPYATGLVRRLACFARMSPSTVLDVQWTSQGNRVGILTERGTIHLHELPRQDILASRLHSPMSAPQSRSGLPSPGSSPQDLPANGWLNNMRTGLQTVQGRLAAVRTRSESDGLAQSTLATIGSASVAARYAGGRVVRNGYNIAVEGAHNLRHAEDNKIRLQSKHHTVRPMCFWWLSGRDEGLLSTVADGVICTYAVKSRFHTQGKKTIVSLDASRKANADHTLKRITQSKLAPAIAGRMDSRGAHGDCARLGVHGFWTPAPPKNVRIDLPTGVGQSAAIITQDKDTSPQYMPLHRYRQVDLLVYSKSRDPAGTDEALGIGSGSGPWLFGLPLPSATKVNCQSSTIPQSPDHDVEGIVGTMEEDFMLDRANDDDVGVKDIKLRRHQHQKQGDDLLQL